MITNVFIDLFFIDGHWFSDKRNLGRYLILANFIVKTWFAFVAIFIFVCLTFLKHKIQDNRIRLATLATELALLKSQTHPHFLFNTLNSLYVSSHQFGDLKTAEGIGQMSAILRYMLHKHSSSKVLLTDEVALISDYIELHKLRFTECLTVTFDYKEPINHVDISPMILIILVENAFKYGIKTNEISHINLKLHCDNTNLVFTVSNTNFSQSVKTSPNHQPSGIGIANLKQRLAMLYPNNHRLTITETQTDFMATLELTLC